MPLQRFCCITVLIITVFLTSCNINNQTMSKDLSQQMPEGYIPSGEYPGSLEQIKQLEGETANDKNSRNDPLSDKINYNTVKGVWISYLNLKIKNMNGQQYTDYIGDMFLQLKQYGINTVYFQVRPYGDALYKSEIFPWSHILTGQQGIAPDYDPLEIAIQKAHENGLSFHAWINPFRVQTSNGENAVPAMMSADNPALTEQESITLTYDGNIWYDPASERAHQLIADGIYEIISKYNVDGIQFDDYFYPTSDNAIDAMSYEQYKASGGELAQDDWRRDNVSRLVKRCYEAIKSYDSDIIFGISPSADINKNMNQLYADVKLWTSCNEYIDYICPQIYFGFDNASLPYEQTLQSWISLVQNFDVQLYVGLAGYKTGELDKYAGKGKQEWKQNDDIIMRQAKIAIEDKKLFGISLYDVDFITGQAGEIRQNERENLKQYLAQLG